MTPQVRHRALVVDDEVPLARLVSSYLENSGFEVAQAFDGTAALSLVRAFDPDIVILDLGLPGMDGTTVCRELRTFSDCYVIMLTARTDEQDKLAGLSLGADDYLTKPFSPRELVARAQAMLRRSRHGIGEPGPVSPLVFGELLIDLGRREVRKAGQPIEVTRTEFSLLATLAARPAHAFSRRDLLHSVWGQDYVGDEHLVDVHVRNLRRRLGEDATDPKFVRTVRGVGYGMGTGT